MGEGPLKDKHYLGILGIIITIAGWVILSANHFPFVYRLVSPHYMYSVSALEQMKQKGKVLKKGDKGFQEISEIIEILMGRDFTPQITQIKPLRGGQTAIDPWAPNKFGERLRFEITFSNSRKQVWDVEGLSRAIKKRYLTLDVFLWGSVVFGVGVLLSLISLLIKEEK